MNDTTKTKSQLITELNRLRQQNAALQSFAAESHPGHVQPDQRFRTVLENMKLIAVMLDRNGQVIFCNDYLLALTGWQREEILHTSWFDRFLPPEIQQSIREGLFASAASGGVDWAYHENEIVTRTGERRLIAWRNTAAYDSQNQCIGITSIGEDITKRYQVEAALQESAATARVLLNAPVDSVILINEQGTILDLNATAAYRLGRPITDLIGANLYDQFPADITERRKAQNQAILASGQPRRLEDTRAGIWYDTVIYPVADEHGEASRLAIVARDITERKKAEDQIRYQAELLDNVSDAIISTDLAFNVLSWNNGAEALFGWSSGEAVGQSLLALTKPQSPHEPSNTIVASFFANGSWNGEMIQHHKDGRPLNIDVKITLVKDDTGAPSRIVSVNHDITEGKRLEGALKTRANEVALLYEIGKQLAHTLDLEAIYHTLHDVVYSVMDCARLYITTYTPADNLIRCVFAFAQGKPLNVSTLPSIPLEQEGRGTQSRVIRSGESLYLPDFQAALQTAQSIYHVDDEGAVTTGDKTPEDARLVRSGLIVPLKFEGQVMGTIQVLSLKLDAYTEDNLRFLEALAPQVTAVMVNATLYQQAQDEIAERKRSEEALRISEERLRQREEQIRAQYNAIPVPTFTWQRTADDDFILTAYNTAALAVTQGKVVDLMGRKASDVYRERPIVLEDLSRCYTEQTTIERETPFQYVTTGENKCVRFRYGFVPPDRVLIHTDDITEQKSIEKALQESQADLTEAQRIGRVGNWVHNLETGQLYWSDELFRIFGRTQKTIAPGESYDWVHPDDREGLREAVEHSIQTRSRLDTQFRILREDGEERMIHYQGEVITDATGKASKTVGTVQDVTDQKRSEAALQQRAAQLTLINGVSGEIAAVLDLDRVLDRAAHLVQESFGYQHVGLFILDPAQGALLMRAKAGTYAARFPEDHRLKLGAGMVGWVAEQGKQLLVNDVSSEPRFHNPFPDEVIGSEFSLPILVAHAVVGVLDVQSQHNNAFDDNDVLVLETLADQIAIAIANARSYQQAQLEIAERKQAEAALRESEGRYRALAEATVDGISITHDGVVLDCNLHCAEILGYQPGELIGKSASLFVFPEDRDLVQRNMRARLDGTYEHRALCKDGSVIVVEAHGKDVLYRGRQARITVIRDITEGKQIEEALYFVAQRGWAVAGETFFPALAKYLAEKLAVDYTFIARLVENREQIAQTVALCEKGELVDNIAYSLAHTPCQKVVDNQPCSYPEKVRQVFPQSKMLADLQVESYVGMPLWDSQGNPIGFIAVMHGKPLGNTALIESLLQIVSVRAAHELERGKAEKQALELAVEKERSQILSKFIREASHEFRTPLSLINLNIYAIKRATESTPQLKRLEAVEAVVQNITALVDDLMTMARLDSGVAREMRPMDIHQALGDLIALMRDYANNGKLKIIQDFDLNRPFYVQATAEELNLAFKNILENAIRYTLEDGTITVRTIRQNGNRVIEIQDTGVGMSEEVVGHIFERFYRVDEAHTTRGFGLGLPIAQKIINMHNGTITVESTPGQGSIFRIILPA